MFVTITGVLVGKHNQVLMKKLNMNAPLSTHAPHSLIDHAITTTCSPLMRWQKRKIHGRVYDTYGTTIASERKVLKALTEQIGARRRSGGTTVEISSARVGVGSAGWTILK